MKFLVRSLIILLALYGILFAIGDAYLAQNGAPLWAAVAFAVIFTGIQYAIAPWIIERLMNIQWDDHAGLLPARNREFIATLCTQRGLKMPRIGVIQSGTPNAFSFGHVPGDSRVVVTTGLLDVLTVEEANAVLAHEIGHIEHWDFAVMTLAALVPLLLYQIYIFTHRINKARLVAYSAYICYLLSQFIVLYLNRTREYFADHYSAEVTHEPNALSSALIKIAYGMVRAEGEFKQSLEGASEKNQARMRRAYGKVETLALMGISNVHSGAALALGLADSGDAAAVMRWDLVNPWARIYELSSTHPLTALRVRELNKDAEEMHLPIQYPTSQDLARRWSLFPVEVAVWIAPLVFGGLFATAMWLPNLIAGWSHQAPMLLMLAGASWMLRVWYRYRGAFQPATVRVLIEDLDVSQMNPRAVQLKGQIVGRGVPGAFWSADLVLRDATGIIFMLYRPSIPFARLLFATTAVANYIGQDVTIEGWFRRGLSPYVEMSRIAGKDGAVHRAYSRWVQYGMAALVILAGWVWLWI